MSKTDLLELFEEGLWRSAAVPPTTLAALGLGHGLAVRLKAVPIFEGKAAMRPELPWQVEPEEQPMMMVPVTEVTMFEQHMTELEHEVAIAELEHKTALAEVPEMSRPEPWDVSELGCKTTVAEVTEVP